MHLKIGMVLKLFLVDTNPPKLKYLIIVGVDRSSISCVSVLINSKPNRKIHWHVDLMALQVPISASDHDFLNYDSFVDCSNLRQEQIYDLELELNSNLDAYVGDVTQTFLETLRNAIKHSNTIKGKLKKKFGFYDS
ncbi:hypothetical protein BST97_11105 [Nonlabens spongiae]|uniref:Uncharacterized protein n=2 Tax=Nonlabens spongiae TaxID=331648 RepID=A0A1W6MLL8_9FLAO|nr:hypothetical protein BST97_11105 [Nonlabens spongiae]